MQSPLERAIAEAMPGFEFILSEIGAEFEEAVMTDHALSPSTRRTYVEHGKLFVRFAKGEGDVFERWAARQAVEPPPELTGADRNRERPEPEPTAA